MCLGRHCNDGGECLCVNNGERLQREGKREGEWEREGERERERKGDRKIRAGRDRDKDR